MTEAWKWIPGFEGSYEVSDQGRVRSVDRVVESVHPRKGTPYRRRYSGKDIAPQRSGVGFQEDNHYLHVTLPDRKCHKVHRIVANAFLPPEEGMTDVNHKNGIKNDNRLCNLEWSNTSANAQHAHDRGLIPHTSTRWFRCREMNFSAFGAVSMAGFIASITSDDVLAAGIRSAATSGYRYKGYTFERIDAPW